VKGDVWNHDSGIAESVFYAGSMPAEARLMAWLMALWTSFGGRFMIHPSLWSLWAWRMAMVMMAAQQLATREGLAVRQKSSSILSYGGWGDVRLAWHCWSLSARYPGYIDT